MVFKIAPRVHRNRFSHVCDQGFHDGVLGMTPRVRTRSVIMNVVLKTTPRVRARDAIPRTLYKNTSVHAAATKKARLRGP